MFFKTKYFVITYIFIIFAALNKIKYKIMRFFEEDDYGFIWEFNSFTEWFGFKIGRFLGAVFVYGCIFLLIKFIIARYS